MCKLCTSKVSLDIFLWLHSSLFECNEPVERVSERACKVICSLKEIGMNLIVVLDGRYMQESADTHIRCNRLTLHHCARRLVEAFVQMRIDFTYGACSSDFVKIELVRKGGCDMLRSALGGAEVLLTTLLERHKKQQTQQPIKVEKQQTQQPIKVEKQQTQQPIKVEKQQTQQPIKVEKQQTQQPIKVEKQQTQQPIKVEKHQTQQPIKVEKQQTKQQMKLEIPKLAEVNQQRIAVDAEQHKVLLFTRLGMDMTIKRINRMTEKFVQQEGFEVVGLYSPKVTHVVVGSHYRDEQGLLRELNVPSLNSITARVIVVDLITSYFMNGSWNDTDERFCWIGPNTVKVPLQSQKEQEPDTFLSYQNGDNHKSPVKQKRLAFAPKMYSDRPWLKHIPPLFRDKCWAIHKGPMKNIASPRAAKSNNRGVSGCITKQVKRESDPKARSIEYTTRTSAQLWNAVFDKHQEHCVNPNNESKDLQCVVREKRNTATADEHINVEDQLHTAKTDEHNNVKDQRNSAISDKCSIESKDHLTLQLEQIADYFESPSRQNKRAHLSLVSSAQKKSNRNIEYWANRREALACQMSGSDKMVNLNSHLTDELENLQAFYEVRGDQWRAMGYKKASQTLRGLRFKVTQVDQVSQKYGIGKSIAAKIDEILTTGNCAKRESLCNSAEYQAEKAFCGIFGVGPTTARRLWARGFRSIEDLRKACKDPERYGRLLDDPRQQVGLNLYEDLQERIPRKEVEEIGEYVKQVARKVYHKHANSLVIEICGSYRRGKSSSGDVDLILTAPNIEEHLPLGPLLEKLRESGFLTHDLGLPLPNKIKSSYMGVCKIEKLHRRLDIKSYLPQHMGFALLYFTGSDHFNRSMRFYAKKLGYTLSDVELRPAIRNNGKRLVSGQSVPCFTEHQVFHLLGLEYRHPWDRNCADLSNLVPRTGS